MKLSYKVSDDEDDDDAFMQRHNLEVLKASVEAKDKQTNQKAFYDECTTDNDDMSTGYENGGGRRNSRRRKKLLSAEEEANLGMSWAIWFPPSHPIWYQLKDE